MGDGRRPDDDKELESAENRDRSSYDVTPSRGKGAQMLLRGACFSCLEENHGNRGGNPPSCRDCVGLRALESTERRWSNHRLSPCEPRLGFITGVQGLMRCRCVANRSWQIFDSAGWSNPPSPSPPPTNPPSSSSP